MDLPPRPPQPTIQITPIASVPSTTYATPRTSGGSLHGSARSKISSRTRPLSRSEFDPIALREEWMRNNLQFHEPRVPTDYSYVIGRPRHKDHRHKKAASISINIPSPLADRLFSQQGVDREAIWAEILAAHSQWYNFNRLPPPPAPFAPVSLCDSLEVGCVFAVITLSTLVVFVILSFVYLKSFVKL